MLQTDVSPRRKTRLERWPSMAAIKPTPQESCSSPGSYSETGNPDRVCEMASFIKGGPMSLWVKLPVSRPNPPHKDRFWSIFESRSENFCYSKVSWGKKSPTVACLFPKNDTAMRVLDEQE